VLLFDDLHWADPASLDLLRVVARQLVHWPMLMLITYRSDEIDARSPLYALIPTLVRETRTERLDLRPLPDDSVHLLVDRRYGLPLADATRLSRYVQQRAEGNPFFIGEIFRALQEESVLSRNTTGWLLNELVDVRVPALVRQVIGLRIHRLDDEVQRLLTIAAVIGQEVPITVWQIVAGVDEESLLTAIERAEAAFLIAGTREGTRIRFVHALIRETLYEGMTAARRRHWHQRTGEVLAAMPGADADAVGYHFEQAGDERAITWLVWAGEAAHRAYAWLTAAQRYQTVVAHLDANSEPSELQATFHYRVAEMLQFSDPQQAIEHIDAVQRIAITLSDHALIAFAQVHRGRLLAFAGALDAALSDLADGMKAMDALASSDIVRLTRMDSARTALQTGRSPFVLQLARAGRIFEAVAIAMNMPSRYRDIAASNALKAENISLGLVIARALLGEPEAAIEVLAEVRSNFASLGDFHVLGFLVIIELRMIVLAYYADDLTGRRQRAKEGEQVWGKAYGVTPDLPNRFPALPLLLLEGQWSEAREVALAVSDNKFVVMGVHAISMLGPLARAQGDVALAWAQVQALFPDGPATRPGTVPFFEALTLQRLAAALALDAGDCATARTWLMMHDAWLDWNGAVLGRADGQLGWAAYHRAIGDLPAATHHVQEAILSASAPRQPLVLLGAHRLLGELATEAGRHTDALAHLGDALALADACAAPYERALCLIALARHHASTGNRAEAGALLGEARALCSSLGALPALAQCDLLERELADTGAAPDRYPDGLSEREFDVLRLIARGMSNREIAATLFISSRTVNRHIENLYRKIDAHNKADATSWALRHHLA
jgi:DNA-binding CsgD family transcriptional regulator